MLEEYTSFIDEGTLNELEKVAGELRGLKVLHVNSTKLGGGVAEILYRMVPLMNELGIETSWEVIRGDLEFFKVTKKIHNLLHLSTGERLTHYGGVT